MVLKVKMITIINYMQTVHFQYHVTVFGDFRLFFFLPIAYSILINIYKLIEVYLIIQLRISVFHYIGEKVYSVHSIIYSSIIIIHSF